MYPCSPSSLSPSSFPPLLLLTCDGYRYSFVVSPTPFPLTHTHTPQTSEHATQEFTQIVTLVALLRHHFQRQQENHTHLGIGTGGGLESKLKLPALSRAKNALASSIDNLRTRQQNNQATKKNIKTSEANGSRTSDERATQSLNLPVHSPIFSRKTKLDELMAPISMSPSPSTEKTLGNPLLPRARERSWSDRLRKHKIRELSSVDDGNLSDKEKEDEAKDKAKESSGKKFSDRKAPPPVPRIVTGSETSSPLNKARRSPSPLTTTPPSVSQEKVNSFQTPQRGPSLGLTGFRGWRSSRTPPAQMVSSPHDHQHRRGHRRSTSYTCRAEIFESVKTPERQSSFDMREYFVIFDQLYRRGLG